MARFSPSFAPRPRGLLHINDCSVEDMFCRDSLLGADSARIERFQLSDRPTQPPQQVYIPPFATPEDLKLELTRQGLLGRSGSIHIPLVSLA